MDKLQQLHPMGALDSTLANSASVFSELRVGHQRFLDGQSVHPNTSRERVRSGGSATSYCPVG